MRHKWRWVSSGKSATCTRCGAKLWYSKRKKRKGSGETYIENYERKGLQVVDFKKIPPCKGNFDEE